MKNTKKRISHKRSNRHLEPLVSQPPHSITLMLTSEQEKQLTPLFKYAMKSYDKGQYGIILAQPKRPSIFGTPLEPMLVCAFVEEPYASKMIKLSRKAGTLVRRSG
jgi:hypothetical protein